MAEASLAENPGARPAEPQGGSAEQPTGKEQPKLFTQEEVNRFLKKQKVDVGEVRDQLTAELTAVRDELTGYKEKITGFDEFFAQLQEPEKPTTATPQEEYEHALQNPPTWVKNQRDKTHYENLCRTQFLGRQQLSSVTQTVDELKKELEGEKKARTAAEAARQEIELSRRDATKRSDLLAIAGDPTIYAVDPEVVYRYYKDETVWDDRSGRWMMRDADDPKKLIDLKAGIKATFPDSLRKSAVIAGGSGSGGSRIPNPEAELTQARAAFEQAQQLAKRSGRTSDIAEYQKAKKTVFLLERELQKVA